ncbi:MAG: tRNA preQ1(34) S-adenosylmethionine ribosyltransferase-isomerase QueA [candidate division WOR-3 bacterium]|uniref:S-adenosylmethionine:tRNA ribosyltransferase-isomerase n=2 Tax=candidate division WOR-3 bacterium TaxID=2052148 RepID=A0A7C1SDJ1_UNCW3|nr:tRNA preQ1(34) S-adenosylmethionine ribosyltransferase-isomerase QueA [candidate division WOR-3 bacterium]
MLVAEFDYQLPKELIAQHPVEPRDHSRLLVVERKTGRFYDCRFFEIELWLNSGDVLVLNNTRVIPARIYGRLVTGDKIELLLLRPREDGIWETLSRPARKAKPGTVVQFDDGFTGVVLERHPAGIRVLKFEPPDISRLLSVCGELALPPYIRTRGHNPERYQTVYARIPGAVAAPTAGLHFTSELIERLKQKGIKPFYLTLHAGLGTFRPVKVEKVEEHRMHPEEFELHPEVAEAITTAKREGRRVVCVGTTTVRVLESRAERKGNQILVHPGAGLTDLFIYPGFDWKVTDVLITNFHLPKSTLLMLVCAFAGRELIMKTYQHAIEQRYRFYSFGDAMMII